MKAAGHMFDTLALAIPVGYNFNFSWMPVVQNILGQFKINMKGKLDQAIKKDQTILKKGKG